MSFGAPDPPDAGNVSNQQFAYNEQAAKAQNKNNSYNQSTPFGSLQYVADPSSPSGYRVETSLSSDQQGLLDSRVQTQRTLGQAGNDLAANSSSMYSTPFDLNSASGETAGLLNSWNKKYLDPIFQMQDSNLEAQLRNQGLTPGSEAYNNAKNLQARNQGDVTTNYLTKNQGQAFDQAIKGYQLPLQTIAGLMSGGAPQSPAFQATPSATIQPPNYAQAAQNQYQGEAQNYQNMIGGAGQVAGLLAGPLTGGLSLGGMFGSSPLSLSSFGGGWSTGNIGGTGGNLGGLY